MANIIPQHEEEGGDEWLGSFSDMVSLLLCFFIVLTAIFSMRNDADPVLLQDLVAGMQSMGSMDEDVIESKKARNAMLDRLEDLSELNENVEFQHNANGLRITFNEVGGNPLFTPGSAMLSRAAQQLIFEVTETLVIPNPEKTKLTAEAFLANQIKAFRRIEIQGHTDSKPMRRGARYLSNWELSLDRANNVRRFLQQIDFPDLLFRKIFVSGYAGQQLAVNEDREFLLLLDPKLKKDLAQNKTEDLFKLMGKKGFATMPGAELISISESDWQILDGEIIYEIPVENNQLRLYKQFDEFEKENAEAKNRRIVIFLATR